MVGDMSDNKDGSRVASRIYCPWKEIEDNYRKYGPQDEFSMKPRFYSLTVAEVNNQDTPKLDGLVMLLSKLVLVLCDRERQRLILNI